MGNEVGVSAGGLIPYPLHVAFALELIKCEGQKRVKVVHEHCFHENSVMTHMHLPSYGGFPNHSTDRLQGNLRCDLTIVLVLSLSLWRWIYPHMGARLIYHKTEDSVAQQSN